MPRFRHRGRRLCRGLGNAGIALCLYRGDQHMGESMSYLAWFSSLLAIAV